MAYIRQSTWLTMNNYADRGYKAVSAAAAKGMPIRGYYGKGMGKDVVFTKNFGILQKERDIYNTPDGVWKTLDEMGEGDKYWDPESGDLVQMGGPSGMDIPGYDAGDQNPFERQPGWNEDGFAAGKMDESNVDISDPSPEGRAGGFGDPTETAGSPPGGFGGGSVGGGGSAPTGGGGQSLPNGSVADTPGDMSLVETDMPGPVDDNLTSSETLGFLGMEQSMGSGGKQYLADIAGGDFDVSELQKRVRTMQAGGGLAYGGAAAKQEARIVGRYKQGRQLQAATQLADLSEKESGIGQEIESALALSELYTTRAATSQLLSPVSAYGTLLSGSKAGQADIFGLGRLL